MFFGDIEFFVMSVHYRFNIFIFFFEFFWSDRLIPEMKNIDRDKSKNVTKENIEKKPIDIFANLKSKDSKTSVE